MKFKKILVLLLFPIGLIAQDVKKITHRYTEFNAGLCYTDEIDFVVPGSSFLIGKVFETKKELLIDAQIGVAFPTIVTAKVGFGKYINKENRSAFFFGIRPWPMHVYGQINLPKQKKGQWIITAELGTEEILEDYVSSSNFDADGFSAFSIGLVSFGYRWDIKSKKDKLTIKDQQQKIEELKQEIEDLKNK